MILVFAFRDFILHFVVAGTAILFACHAFHIFTTFTFMVAGYTGFTHIFTDVDLVVKEDLAAVCVKLNRLRQWRHDTP